MQSYAILSLGLGNALADEHTYDFVYKIRADESLAAVLIDLAGRSQDIGALDIYAHGKVTRSGMFAHWSGGYGSYLGKENLKPATAVLFAPLQHHWGRFGVINLFTCAIADRSGERSDGTFANDGRKLCSGIAAHAGTVVRASPVLQDFRFTGDEDDPDSVEGIDFGDWEGPVFDFYPDGSYIVE